MCATSSATRSRGTTTSSLTLPICTLATAALTALRAAQSRCAWPGSVARCSCEAPARVMAPLAASVSAPTAAGSPSSSTISSAAASPPTSPPPARRTAASAASSRNSSAAGTMPAAVISATAAAARSMLVNIAASVERAFGAGTRRSSTSVITPSVPSEPTSSESSPDRRRVASLAEANDPPVGQHRGDAGDVIRRHAVAERVRSGGVAGDVATDRAGARGARVRRVVQARGGGVGVDARRDRARLGVQPECFGLDAEHAVEPREAEDDAAAATAMLRPRIRCPLREERSGRGGPRTRSRRRRLPRSMRETRRHPGGDAHRTPPTRRTRRRRDQRGGCRRVRPQPDPRGRGSRGDRAFAPHCREPV